MPPRGDTPAYRRGVRLCATVSPKASAAIDKLLALGLHGTTRAEIAQRFIYDGLRAAELFWRAPRPLKPRGQR